MIRLRKVRDTVYGFYRTAMQASEVEPEGGKQNRWGRLCPVPYPIFSSSFRLIEWRGDEGTLGGRGFTVIIAVPFTAPPNALSQWPRGCLEKLMCKVRNAFNCAH